MKYRLKKIYCENVKQEEGGGRDTVTALIINFVFRVNYYTTGSLVRHSNRPGRSILLPNILIIIENGEGLWIVEHKFLSISLHGNLKEKCMIYIYMLKDKPLDNICIVSIFCYLSNRLCTPQLIKFL